MSDNASTSMCVICGRFVLQVPGYAGYLPVYRNFIATWQDPQDVFHGSYHFACLPTWEHREAFARRFEGLVRNASTEHEIFFNGATHRVRERGFGLPELVFAGEHTRIFRSDREYRWAILGDDGACHFIDRKFLDALGRGEPPVQDGGVERTRLLAAPDGDIATWQLPRLLHFLGVGDRYAGALGDEALRYEFFEYDEPTKILEFAIALTLPIAGEALAFLREYAHHYAPLVLEP